MTDTLTDRHRKRLAEKFADMARNVAWYADEDQIVGLEAALREFVRKAHTPR